MTGLKSYITLVLLKLFLTLVYPRSVAAVRVSTNGLHGRIKILFLNSFREFHELILILEKGCRTRISPEYFIVDYALLRWH